MKSKQPRRRARRIGTVVAFGDSTTAPRTIDGRALTVYADLLRQGRLARQVVNAGVGGNSTDEAMARFGQDVLRHRPQWVVIFFGLNDAIIDVWKDPPAAQPRVPIRRYQENLRGFLAALKARRVRVVLMTPNPLAWTDELRGLYGKAPYRLGDPDGLNVTLRPYVRVVRAVARDTGTGLVDVFELFQRHGRRQGRSVGDLLLDGMHPNDRGHRIIAEKLLALMAGPFRRRRPVEHARAKGSRAC